MSRFFSTPSKFGPLVCAAALALAVSGCAGGGESAAGDPTGDADPNATVSYSFGTDGGKNYDPVTAGNQFVNTFLLPVYDRLFDIDEDGNVVPMLAESSSTSADGLALDLTLREGVTFHDGAEFNADAVKANFDRALAAPESTLKADLASISSVEVIDPMTVRFVLSTPNGALPAILADRAGMMVSPNALGNADLDLMPVGAGPYKVIEDQPGVQVSYERYDDYWGDNDSAAKNLNIVIQIDPESRLRAIENGEVDAAGLNMNQVQAIKSKSIRVVEPPKVTTGAYLVYLNMGSNPALADPNVRAAMSLALDRNGIAEGVLSGECTPTAQVFPDGYWAASTDIPDSALDYDAAKAKELLAEAGYPDGFDMSLSAISAQQYANVAEAVAAQLTEIGINVELQIAEPVQVVSNFNAQKTSNAYVSIWPGATDPSKTVSSLFLPTGLFNPGALDTPAVTELATQGIATADQDQRAGIYQDLADAAVESHLHLPICSPNNPNAAGPDIRGLTNTPSGAVDLRNIEKTK